MVVYTASVTSIIPSPNNPKDSLLIGTLDSQIRLMDRSNGKMLNTFSDPEFMYRSYRSQVAFGHGEGFVLAGDEEGKLWAWDVIDVRLCPFCDVDHLYLSLWMNGFSFFPCLSKNVILNAILFNIQGKPLKKGGHKIHERVIMWVEQHPRSGDEMLTASAGESREEGKGE